MKSDTIDISDFIKGDKESAFDGLLITIVHSDFDRQID